MRDFPSCMGESGTRVSDSSSKSAQNLVTCQYQAKLGHMSSVITITWRKTLMGQSLCVKIDDSDKKCLFKIDVKPWLLAKWRGSKCSTADSSRIRVFWDLSSAKFGSGPEPLEGFYVAILFNHEMVLLLGDMAKEANEKANVRSPSPCSAVFVAKKVHVFGKKVYCTKAQFHDSGQVHDVVIECETVGLQDPFLEIRIDKMRVLQVKKLSWKFRGNQTIVIDGVLVEVFWDVHSWLFGSDGHVGNAVFMFQTCSCSMETQLRCLGFSLVLYAWKHD